MNEMEQIRNVYSQLKKIFFGWIDMSHPIWLLTVFGMICDMVGTGTRIPIGKSEHSYVVASTQATTQNYLDFTTLVYVLCKIITF